MSKETLEERMKRDILICIKNSKNRRVGSEYRGGTCSYCTYHQPTTSIREPIMCGYLGLRVMILMGASEDPLMRHYVNFYKCRKKF